MSKYCPALSSVSTSIALSRASSVMVMVDTGMRNDFIGHVIVFFLLLDFRWCRGWSRRQKEGRGEGRES